MQTQASTLLLVAAAALYARQTFFCRNGKETGQHLYRNCKIKAKVTIYNFMEIMFSACAMFLMCALNCYRGTQQFIDRTHIFVIRLNLCIDTDHIYCTVSLWHTRDLCPSHQTDTHTHKKRYSRIKKNALPCFVCSVTSHGLQTSMQGCSGCLLTRCSWAQLASWLLVVAELYNCGMLLLTERYIIIYVIKIYLRNIFIYLV